ncbi:hypothetical protein B0O80DRAFT_493673 [Mortierella sp. GBAus27b]|nr:hypothetical protein BGX31_010276 [Mortierella sp. GBA43]KAI8361058.1 hypothetical protein B0O80DRAFT_493673 [Mortierella sp. GBAus27b]
MSSTTENIKTETLSAGPTGGHLSKKQRKDQFETLSALQTQLDVSVSLARNKVASWFDADGFSDDEDTSNQSGGFTAATVIKPRQPGLGLGAKFISHKDQMRHVPLNAFESKLKRQLTGGVIQSELQRAEATGKDPLPDKYLEHKMMMATKRKEQQEKAEDEEDSRTRNVGGGSAKSSHTHVETVSTAKSDTDTPSSKSSSPPVKPNKQKLKYQASVHPAALKAAPSDHMLESSTSVSKAGQMGGKKRSGDFFSMYMDERANKMARKKAKSTVKRDSDDDGQ